MRVKAIIPSVDKFFDNVKTDTVSLDPVSGTATATLSVKVTNSNLAPMMIYQDMVDALPKDTATGQQLTVASSPGFSAVCTDKSGNVIANNSGFNSLSYQATVGTVQATPPAPTAGLTTYTLPANTIIPAGTCTFSFKVNVPGAGTYTKNIPAGTQTSVGDLNNTTSTLIALAPPTTSKAYSPTSIINDGTSSSSLTITLGNSNSSALTLTSALNDNIDSSGALKPVLDAANTTCTLSSVSVNGTSVTYASGAVIPSGGCKIVVKVSSSTAGTYPNTIAAGALQTNGGSNASSTSSTLTVAAPAPALSLSKTHSGNFTLNQQGTYILTVSNVGTAPTNGALTIKDALPAGMQFVSATSSQGTISGAPSSGTTGTVGFTFTPSTPLAVNGSITITVTVLPTQGGTLTNSASVEGGGDPDTGLTPGSTCTINQCASDSTVINAPQLTISKTDNGQTFKTSTSGGASTTSPSPTREQPPRPAQ